MQVGIVPQFNDILKRYVSGPANSAAHSLRIVERSGSGVELRNLDYKNLGSNPGCGIKTLGKSFHSTLLQFT